jgi:hypothetical protein
VTLGATIEACRDEVGRRADGALAGARSVGDLAALLAGIEGVVARALGAARPEGMPPPACGPGCARCCTVNVGTLAIEGAVAAAWLRERLAPVDRAPLGARLLAFHERVRWLEDRERVGERLACPLLDPAGRCTVHPVRPLACRSVSSLDATECADALAASSEGEDAPMVRMDLAQQALYLEALSALGAALARRGLDARTRDVSGMVGIFLADAARLADFLEGARAPLE